MPISMEEIIDAVQTLSVQDIDTEIDILNSRIELLEQLRPMAAAADKVRERETRVSLNGAVQARKAAPLPDLGAGPRASVRRERIEENLQPLLGEQLGHARSSARRSRLKLLFFLGENPKCDLKTSDLARAAGVIPNDAYGILRPPLFAQGGGGSWRLTEHARRAFEQAAQTAIVQPEAERAPAA